MDFNKEVIDLSFKVPVVVDFWAPWCGPCQQLGPMIEQLADEAKGKWKLAKVNVDENPDVAKEYGIRGIPDVRMFFKGKSVAGFTGALPKYQIEKWLHEHLPDERKDKLEKILAEGNLGNEHFLQQLEQFVSDNPDVPEATVSLAEHVVFKDPERALALISPLSGQAKFLDRMENVKALARLMECRENGDTAIHGKIEEARQAVQQADFDAGLKTLIEAVMMDKSYCDELPRQATIAIFQILGENHELTRKYRRRFDMALY